MKNQFVYYDYDGLADYCKEMQIPFAYADDYNKVVIYFPDHFDMGESVEFLVEFEAWKRMKAQSEERSTRDYVGAAENAFYDNWSAENL